MAIGTFDYIIVVCSLLLILLIWITLVLTRDRQDPAMKEMKRKSVKDGTISRRLLGEFVYDAIIQGEWSP
jgi:hypothetical protein